VIFGLVLLSFLKVRPEITQGERKMPEHLNVTVRKEDGCVVVSSDG
jgi:hypothetical protein